LSTGENLSLQVLQLDDESCRQYPQTIHGFVRRKRTREQTRQEYDLLARIRHNNIVGVSGLFSTPSSDAIVMDL
jgi:serine/threonine protein kinase